MTRTLSVAGGLILAAILYVSLQSIGSAPRLTGAFAASGDTTVSTGAGSPDASSDPIEDLAAWPGSAGR